MDFTVDDGELLTAIAVPAVVARALAVLDALPDGRLVTLPRLAADCGVLANSFDRCTMHPALRDYRIQATYGGRRRTLYGNRSTIAAYREAHHE